MLELRPNCEYCDKDLLHNVCPNCGGGFAPRPIRPKRQRRQGVGLDNHPASTTRVSLKYSREEVAAFVAGVKDTAPEHR